MALFWPLAPRLAVTGLPCCKPGQPTPTIRRPSVRLGETAARFIWQTSAGVYHKQYFNETEFNLTALSVSTGPGVIVPNKWRAKLNLQVDGLYLGGNYLGLYTSISPTVVMQMKNGELTWDALVLKKDFDRAIDNGRNSHYYQTGVSYGHLLMQGKLALQGGVHVLRRMPRRPVSATMAGKHLVV